MKIILIIAFILILGSNVQGQEKPKTVEFGKQFIDTIILPSKYNYLKSIQLYTFNRKLGKQFYNDPSKLNEKRLNEKSNNLINIIIVGKNENNSMVLIPPLKPNRLYVQEIKYVGKYDIYGIFREIHSEGKFKNYDEKSVKWLETIQIYNQQTPFKLIYNPSMYELEKFKNKVDTLNIPKKTESLSTNKLDSLKKNRNDIKIEFLKKIVYDNFEILRFRQATIKDESIISFYKYIKDTPSITDSSWMVFIEIFGQIPDYLNIYDFYIRRLKVELDNKVLLSQSNYEEIIDTALKNEKDEYIINAHENGLPLSTPLPNYLNSIGKAIEYSKKQYFTTYSEVYQTNYTRVLTPDFGYIAYPYSKGVQGGALYLGVHIALSPSNKNIPLQLSKLNLWQRLSIHTGITLNSLKKVGYRDDFFNDYSLLLGGGYKLFTQSTRLNFGGVFFKKLDPVSGISSIAIQPYIGLSIDIEIKKWLEGIIPKFKNNFDVN